MCSEQTIYLFPNPPLQDDNFEVQQDVVQTGAPQLFSNSVKTVAAFLNTPNSNCPQFLRGLNIILARDLHIMPELKRRFIERIEEAGGSVVDEDDYSSDMIDIVICRFRIGALYTQVLHPFEDLIFLYTSKATLLTTSSLPDVV